MPKRSLPNRQAIEKLDQAVTQLLAAPKAKLHTEDPELLPLLRVAAELRQLPREDFKARLKSDLQRKSPVATMTETAASVRTVASPRMTFKDVAKAIEFYKSAFGAKETFRFEIGKGIAHAEIRIGDSVVMLAEEWPEGGRYSPETTGNSPVAMTIQVPDVDAFAGRAIAAGAKLQRPIADQFYGRRDANLVDPFGYPWSVFTVTEDMSVEEMHRRFRAMTGGEKRKPAVDPIPKGYSTLTTYLVAQDADGLITFLTKAFGAEETFRSGPGSEGGLHAEVRIGDSMLMVGGGGAGMEWRGTPMPSAFHIYVRDCDATYARALEAGATSIDKPADQSYGERSATVQDAAGNSWYIATYKGESAHAAAVSASAARRTGNQLREACLRSAGTGAARDTRWRDPPRHPENWQCLYGDGRSSRSLPAHADHVLPVRRRLRCLVQARHQRRGDIDLRAQRSTLRRPQRWRDRSLRQQVVHRDPHQRHVGFV